MTDIIHSTHLFRLRCEESIKIISEAVLSDNVPTRQEIDLTNAYKMSKKTLGDYVTLDWQHVEAIIKIIQTIKRYYNDPTQKRPINIMMIAEPGSGKSHLIKCIARKMSNMGICAVDFNMSQVRSIDDMAQSLEQVRNLKITDKLPILFLDEIDSDVANYSRLLPLLWDGNIQARQQELKMGKIVLVLAASTAEVINTIKETKSLKNEDITGNSSNKLIDLLSRINGGIIEIPKLEEKKNKRDRRVDKICLSLSILQNRFGNNLRHVPWSLLRFIGLTKFRYNVRSITHLIDLIPWRSDIDDTLITADINLPLMSVKSLLSSSLAFHIYHDDGPQEIIDDWIRYSNVKTMVTFDKDIQNKD